MADAQEKLVYFQAMTGLEDHDLCTDILAAHGWDLELAVSAFTGGNPSEPDAFSPTHAATDSGGGVTYRNFDDSDIPRPESTSLVSMAPNLAWRLVTLPISVVSGGLGLVSGAIGLGFWVAGGVLSYSLGMLGFGSGRPGESSARPPVAVTPAGLEAAEFVAAFETEYGGSTRPNFVSEGFMDALQRSRRDYKLLFVYLHSPDHQDTPAFCERTLCNEVLAAFINENFVAWGGSIRSSEGFKMSNSLRASRFPFCGVVMAATNQRIALLQQVEGPRSPDEVLTALQKVLEENGPSLAVARIEAEERRNNALIREEQDAAYRAALEADRARDLQKKEEQELLEREAAEAERKRKEEEEALERQAREASEREASLARRRQEKALSLGAEPDKAADVTQVLVRFPTGERKERRFHSSSTIQTLYDYVDSLECLSADDYCLVSNFPRTVYGPEKRSLTLKEAGLHPQAGLFVELNS